MLLPDHPEQLVVFIEQIVYNLFSLVGVDTPVHKPITQW